MAQGRKNTYYNGNPNIKKAGVKQSYTKEQLEEYKKCAEDVEYFVENYVTIVSLDDGEVLFKMWDFQKNMLSVFNDNRFSIALLPRQMGKSIVVAAYILHYVIFNKSKSVIVLSNEGANAQEILERIQLMYENLPFFLQPGVKEYNKTSVLFGNGGKIRSASTANNSVRGRSYNLVYLDEFAFVENADKFYTSTYPVISSGKTTKVIITSTPNGMNLFHKMWVDASAGKSRFVPFRAHWWDRPDRDETWKQETLANTSTRQFAQEFECAFFGSSGTLIDGQVLATLTWDEPIEDKQTYRVWEEPIENHQYVATVDVGEGVGGDYSVISIFDVTIKPYKVVYRFHDNLTAPLILTEILNRVGTKYNDALVVIESNFGSQVGSTLWNDYEYENMLLTTVKGSENVVSGGFGGKSLDYGVKTTKKTKRIGCSNLKSLIESHVYIPRDTIEIDELATFVAKGTSYEAEDEKHDDVAMTLVIFAWLTTQEYFRDLTNSNVVRDIISKNMEALNDSLMIDIQMDDGGLDAMNEYAEFGPDSFFGHM